MGMQLISYTAYELATSDTSDDDVYGVSYGRVKKSVKSAVSDL